VIILKLLGLYLLFESSTWAISLFGTVVKSYYMQDGGESWIGIFAPYLFSIALQAFFCYLLLMRPERIIDKLKLGEGFYEESFTFNADIHVLAKFATIAGAIFLLAACIPELCRAVIEQFIYAQSGGIIRHSSGGDIVMAILKIIAAYILIVKSDQIAQLINKRSPEKAESSPEE